MIKNIMYDGAWLPSAEIDGVPYAIMEPLLNHIIRGAWADYIQVLNSNEDLQYDLSIKCIDGTYAIPVTEVSRWLYSFSLKNMGGNLYDRFRVFRRDVEKSYRVVWALEAGDLVIKGREVAYEGHYTDRYTAWDISAIFGNAGVPDIELEGGDNSVRTVLDYINHVAAGTACGSRGNLLCEQIDYIENMVYGEEICEHINDILAGYIPEETEYLDDYIDSLNVFISGEASRFVGEY